MEQLIERWAKIPQRQRYAVVVVLLVGLVGGYYYFFYAEQASQLDSLRSKYQSLEAQRAEKQAYIDNLAKYEARLNELQQDLNKARAQLPDDPDVPQLLAQLGNKARQSALFLDSFQPTGETVKDFVADLTFNMEVHGSYHEIGTFTDAISKLDRIVNVTDISMTSPKTENQKVVVKGNFIVRTYRFVGAAKKEGNP